MAISEKIVYLQSGTAAPLRATVYGPENKSFTATIMKKTILALALLAASLPGHAETAEAAGGEEAGGGELVWYGDSRRGARQGAGPHSPVAIQAHLRQLSTFPTWKKKNPSAHELGTVRMIKFTGDWLGAGRIRLCTRKLPRERGGQDSPASVCC